MTASSGLFSNRCSRHIDDRVINILKDNAKNADVTMLLDSGVDLHSFQPTGPKSIHIQATVL